MIYSGGEPRRRSSAHAPPSRQPQAAPARTASAPPYGSSTSPPGIDAGPPASGPAHSQPTASPVSSRRTRRSTPRPEPQAGSRHRLGRSAPRSTAASRCRSDPPGTRPAHQPSSWAGALRRCRHSCGSETHSAACAKGYEVRGPLCSTLRRVRPGLSDPRCASLVRPWARSPDSPVGAVAQLFKIISVSLVLGLTSDRISPISLNLRWSTAGEAGEALERLGASGWAVAGAGTDTTQEGWCRTVPALVGDTRLRVGHRLRVTGPTHHRSAGDHTRRRTSAAGSGCGPDAGG